MVLFNRYDGFDMQLPAIVSIDWYKQASLKRNLEILISTHFKNELVKENQISSGKSQSHFPATGRISTMKIRKGYL